MDSSAAQAGEREADEAVGAPARPAAELAGAEQTAEAEPLVRPPGETPRPWLAAYPPNVPASYDYPVVAMPQLLDDAAIDFPEHVAVRFDRAATTYRQLLDETDRLAAALAELGVRRGDRVSVLLPSCPQHVSCLFAAWRLGAVVATHDPSVSAEVLARQILDAQSSVVVCLDRLYPRLAELKGRVPSVRHVVVASLREALPFPKNVLTGVADRWAGRGRRPRHGEGVLRFADLVEAARPLAEQAPIDPVRDAAALRYPVDDGRAVVLTHGGLVTAAFQARLWLADTQAGHEELLLTSPLSDWAGLVLGVGFATLSAASLVLLDQEAPDAAVEAVDRHQPTMAFGDPSLFTVLADADEVLDLSSLRVGLVVGGLAADEVVHTVEQRTGGKVRQGWGHAESGGLTHANPIYGKAKGGTVGLPLPDVACALRSLDDPRQLAPAGQPGRLAIGGPQLAAGYWRHPERTAADLDSEGWLVTDVPATMDEDGYIRLLDPSGASVPGDAHGRGG